MSKSVLLSMRVAAILFLSSQFLACQTHPAKESITLPATGMSDPHLHFFDDKFWLFAGHDVGPESTDWIMPEWRVYSSNDLVSWQHETTITPKDNYMPDDSTKCWAPDAATRDGKYYFYFSHFNKTTGVMKADNPGGPYKDALGKPLLPEDLTPSLEFDPTVYTDDDATKTPYIIFGYKKKGGYYIAKLNEDMISLAETPKLIEIRNDTSPHIDKNFMHKYKGTYYLTSGGFYSTSDNLYGPYEFRGLTGDGHGLGIFSHGSFLEHKGQWFHTWTRYLDRSKSKYRESFMTYAHYKQDGALVSDTRYLDKHKEWGVGRYDATWDKIEAEWFFASKEIEKIEAPNEGFAVQFKKPNAHIHFPKVQNLPENATLTIHGNATNGGASIKVHSKSLTGPVLATCQITSSQPKEHNCRLDNKAGEYDLYFVGSNPSADNITIDWFGFQ